ncbi:MAG: phycobiliprotein lyase [Cyanobacteria bacterium P01_G01_bin.38]
MEIVNFFEKLAGKWFSQRTTHDLATQQSKAGKSDLEAELLTSADADVEQLCKSLSVDPSFVLCGLKVSQKSTVEGNPKQQFGSALIVPLTPETGTPEGTIEGTLLSHTASHPPTQSRYSLANEVLTIETTHGTTHAQERWWFITDNLRMRTSVLEHQDGSQVASFCSEIRMGGHKPPTS